MSRERFAAVLMDCQMPLMNGFDTTREIRRREQGLDHTPIIAMTGNTMDGDRDRCLAAGMDDYLSKPLRGLDLNELLSRWIAQPASAEDVARAADRH